MPRYVAFLRGVSPSNAKMPELKRCFEAAGFSEVRTILSSGNVAFCARAATTQALERQAQAAMQAMLARTFGVFVRSSEALQALIDADPFARVEAGQKDKRVVTFLRAPGSVVALPIERDGVRILKRIDMEVLTVYEPNPAGPVFMAMLEQAFGKDITTRTFDTVRKCAKA